MGIHRRLRRPERLLSSMAGLAMASSRLATQWSRPAPERLSVQNGTASQVAMKSKGTFILEVSVGQNESSDSALRRSRRAAAPLLREHPGHAEAQGEGAAHEEAGQVPAPAHLGGVAEHRGPCALRRHVRRARRHLLRGLSFWQRRKAAAGGTQPGCNEEKGSPPALAAAELLRGA